jgi:glycosyl transferase family 1
VLIVFYISGHGLGHTSRSVELIEALIKQRHDLRIVVRTTAPAWLFERIEPASLDVERFEGDPGVVQIDSLHHDERATAIRAAEFYRDFDRRIDEESRYLQTAGARLVIGDVPPLAFAAAKSAGISSVAVSNFTWDWIYAYFPEFEALAPGVIETIKRAYADATLALRLPIQGGFEPMRDVVRDIPFIARKSARDPADTRRRLGLDGRRPVVLSSFGAVGIELPYDRIGASGLAVIEERRLPPAGIRYEDLVRAVDVVVSRPGYGIVSDCIANDAPLLYTSRGRFAEYEVMVTEMPRVLRCRHIPREDLLSGNWAAAVEAVLAQPRPVERVDVNGAAVAAAQILELVS